MMRIDLIEATHTSLAEIRADPGLIRLHFAAGTRAVRVRWLLEEIGVPYELRAVNLRWGAHKRQDYLNIHPLGKVPALEIDNTVVFESLGICLYLAERFTEADLAPNQSDRKLRADYCTWMAFSSGTLEPSIFEVLREQKAKERNIANIGMGPALTPFANVASFMERHLETRPFLLGDRMTAADIMNGSLMSWAQDMGLLDERDAIRAWIKTLKSRPAYSRAIESA